MTETDARGKIEYIINRLRYVTLAVQVMPFVYAALYIITLFLYALCPEHVLWVLDTLFYTSPTVAIGFLILSRLLKLCYWHKTACLLPVAPQIVVFADYISPFTITGRFVSVGIPLVLAIILLIAAYNVFMK